MFFFFILLVFLMGFSILRAFKNILFGSGGNTKKKSEGHHRQNSNNNYSEQRNTKEYSHASSRKKIFTKDEGEYVDYEEVK
ncbi:MAG: hypothetical protein PARBA_02463 [Parabacteroides sp.]